MTELVRWRHAKGFTEGTSHAATSLPCQDFALSEVLPGPDGAEVFVAVAADGAGSAPFSADGSKAACHFILDALRDHVESGVCHVDRALGTELVLGARARLSELAAERHAAPRDFACTLLVAVVSEHWGSFLQIGDGAIVYRVDPAPDPASRFEFAFWPERGEYANTTSFLTDDAELGRAEWTRGVVEVALFTDGIQALVLDYKARAVHAPFFERMFAPVRARPEPGELLDLSAALVDYLNSPPLTARTDDDKTLVLASRVLARE